jgi:dihydroxyacid dehydratase/phosphogluconate dehydratase
MSDKTGIRRGLTNYGDQDFAQYLRNSFARSMGLSREMLAKPIVGIAMTPSSFNNCHRAMPELVDAVSRGVLAAGALPMPFPTTSLGEVFLNPTSMVYRNLMAMDTEEMIRAQPMDAVVLIGGCDKTVPAQIMGAASADIPAVQLVTGPMSTGRHRGERSAPAPIAAGSGQVSRGRGRRRAEIATGRGAPRHHRRHLRRDGHGQHHGLHRRNARPDACPTAPRSRPSTPTGCVPRAERSGAWPRA